MNIGLMFKRGVHELQKNSPHVYTGFALLGLGATILFAHKAGKEGPKRMEELKAEKEKPKVMDIVKKEAPVYCPLVIAAGFTAFSVLKVDIVWQKRYTGLGQLLTASELAYQRLYDKTKEEIGDKRMKKIEHDIHQEEFNKRPFEECNVYHTGHGDTLFALAGTGGTLLFRSSIVELRKVEPRIADRLKNEMSLSFRDVCMELDLPDIGDMLGEATGWSAEMWGPCLCSDTLCGDFFKFSDSIIIESTGESATVVDFYRRPSRNYDKC